MTQKLGRQNLDILHRPETGYMARLFHFTERLCLMGYPNHLLEDCMATRWRSWTCQKNPRYNERGLHVHRETRWKCDHPCRRMFLHMDPPSFIMTKWRHTDSVTSQQDIPLHENIYGSQTSVLFCFWHTTAVELITHPSTTPNTKPLEQILDHHV